MYGVGTRWRAEDVVIMVYPGRLEAVGIAQMTRIDDDCDSELWRYFWGSVVPMLGVIGIETLWDLRFFVSGRVWVIYPHWRLES